jgi:hypothetical protein
LLSLAVAIAPATSVKLEQISSVILICASWIPDIMVNPLLSQTNTSVVYNRAATLFELHFEHIHKRTDRMFVALMLVQWLSAVVVALTVSPHLIRTFASRSIIMLQLLFIDSYK